MTENEDSDEIPVTIETNENQISTTESEVIEEQDSDSHAIISELKESLVNETKKAEEYEAKLQHTLADYKNLERKTKQDIENGVNLKIDALMLDLLQVYDDFVRAKTALAEQDIDIKGLDGILKNMNSMLSKYDVSPITALGEIFDPKIHEAISVIDDPDLDDGTITKEIRKGYICQNRIIRTTLVEISKKVKTDN